MKPYVYLGMILVVLTIFVAVMVLVFKSNVSYIIGMIGEVAMMAIIIMLYVAANSGVDTIKTMASYFGMGNVVKVNYLPAIFWTVMQIVSIILCIVGIAVKDTTAEKRRVRTISRRTGMTSGEVRPGTVWEQGGRQQTDYINRDSWGARQEQNNIAEEQKYQMNDRQEFYGAIIGCQGEYIGKALELTEKEPVFVEEFPVGKPFIIFFKERLKNNNTSLWIADTTLPAGENLRAFFYLYDFPLNLNFGKKMTILKPFPHWEAASRRRFRSSAIFLTK